MISIIIPTFNRTEDIIKTFDSVMGIREKEVIVVDDCSDIVNSEYIKNESIKRGFLFIRNSTNRGLSVARNNGLIKATGEYVFFLDSDDIMTGEFVEWVNSTPLVEELYRFQLRWLRTGKIVGFPTSFRKVSKCDFFNISQVSSFLIKKDVFNSKGITFRGRYAEDKIFLSDLIRERANFRELIIKIPSIEYRTDNMSLTRSEISTDKINGFIGNMTLETGIDYFIYLATLKEMLNGRGFICVDGIVINKRNLMKAWLNSPLYFKATMVKFILKYKNTFKV